MASVPSAGCLLAKNQYYRSKCTGGRAVLSPRVRPPSLCLMVWAFCALAGFPELIDKCWWIKSFFHNEPSPLTVGRKTLSAS
ncbi:PDPFL protein, partial [Eolophus roseicapillus]|nr:PDPFL protein [Eolophus roseicapilla]